MPNGIGTFTLITEQIPGLTVTGPGIGERQERELGGRKYWVMPVRADRRPAASWSSRSNGLPSTDSTGRNVAGVLTLMLIAGAFAFGRRPKGGRQGRRRRGRARPAGRQARVDVRRADRARAQRARQGGGGDGARRPPQAAGRRARADLPRPGRAGRTPAGMTDVGAAALRLSKVGKIYDGRRALADVSATFEPGRIAAVLGPNGAGKSTLLGILSTLIAPSAGEVRWGEERARARLVAAGAHRLRRARAGPLRRSHGHREPHAVRVALRCRTIRPARAAALLGRVGLGTRRRERRRGPSRAG